MHSLRYFAPAVRMDIPHVRTSPDFAVAAPSFTGHHGMIGLLGIPDPANKTIFVQTSSRRLHAVREHSMDARRPNTHAIDACTHDPQPARHDHDLCRPLVRVDSDSPNGVRGIAIAH